MLTLSNEKIYQHELHRCDLKNCMLENVSTVIFTLVHFHNISLLDISKLFFLCEYL